MMSKVMHTTCDFLFVHSSHARDGLVEGWNDVWPCRQATESKMSNDSIEAGDGGAEEASASAYRGQRSVFERVWSSVLYGETGV